MRQQTNNRFFTVITMLVLSILQMASAEDYGTVISEKEGLRLHARQISSTENGPPVISCVMENGTGKAISFLEIGSEYSPPLEIRMFDAKGVEIPRTDEWVSLHETGLQMHLSHRVFDEGFNSPILFNLGKAFGERWKDGVRVKFTWNEKETRTGLKYGGELGVATGMTGGLEIIRPDERPSGNDGGTTPEKPSFEPGQSPISGDNKNSSPTLTISENPPTIDSGTNEHHWGWIAGSGLLFVLLIYLWVRFFKNRGQHPSS